MGHHNATDGALRRVHVGDSRYALNIVINDIILRN